MTGQPNAAARHITLLVFLDKDCPAGPNLYGDTPGGVLGLGHESLGESTGGQHEHEDPQTQQPTHESEPGIHRPRPPGVATGLVPFAFSRPAASLARPEPGDNFSAAS